MRNDGAPQPNAAKQESCSRSLDGLGGSTGSIRVHLIDPLSTRTVAFAVSSERLRLRLPAKCVNCGVVGGITVESTIQGRSVRLRWCCSMCSHEWPVLPEERELAERRKVQDRRRVTRADRRRPKR